MDLSRFDFKEQYYRKIVHELFSVLVSYFSLYLPYGEIKREILEIMAEEPYKTAIKKAKFKGSIKAKFMNFAMKHKLIRLIKFYSSRR